MIASRSPSPRSRVPGRRTVETAVLLTILLLVLRTWCVRGLLVPFQVTSGSMAETLLGPHCRIVCRECGFEFVCGSDRREPGVRVVCPNCGCGGHSLDDWPELPGDRLMMDKTTFQIRPPRRFEVVAFRDPQHPSQIVVKRVVGLPGESIQIRDGDVYVDGEIVRKTLAQQRAMAVLVHDARFLPRQDPDAMPWQPERSGGRWVVGSDGWTHAEVPGDASGEESTDWLAYVHRRPVLGQRDQTREVPVSNQCAYNQASRERGENLDAATDLMLSLRVVRTSGRGELAVRIGDGWEEFEVWVSPRDRRLRVCRNGEGKAAVEQRLDGSIPPISGGVRLGVSTFDRQLLVAINGRPVAEVPYERGGEPRKNGKRGLAVGCRDLGVEVREVRVFRDVYYARPAAIYFQWGMDSPAILGKNEYYVLGDNGPISEDSRTWPQGPALSGEYLIGKPLLVHYPASAVRFLGGRFQVPDLARIRYIR